MWIYVENVAHMLSISYGIRQLMALAGFAPETRQLAGGLQSVFQ